jgi:AcrR family transcriptional regulator
MTASPRSARPDRYTADMLVRAAVDIFTARGYDSTSMEDIASAIGITKSSIYHHVRGKEALLRLALARGLDALLLVTEEPGGREGRAIDRLEYVVRRSVEILAADLPYVTLLVRARGHTEAEMWALAQRRNFDRQVAGLVQQATADGDLRGDIPPPLATRLLFGLVNSLTEWWHPDREPPAVMADAVVRLAFDGLRRPAAH